MLLHIKSIAGPESDSEYDLPWLSIENYGSTARSTPRLFIETWVLHFTFESAAVSLNRNTMQNAFELNWMFVIKISVKSP